MREIRSSCYGGVYKGFAFVNSLSKSGKSRKYTKKNAKKHDSVAEKTTKSYRSLRKGLKLDDDDHDDDDDDDDDDCEFCRERKASAHAGSTRVG